MLVFGTEMHLVTFIFIALESIMLGCQLIVYYIRPNDDYRKWYIILLFLLIVYNITGGLLPDPKINIPVYLQNIIAYGTGFIMASYFPFYFYKAFDLRLLRFHALYGVPLFLIIPYLLFFVISYSIHEDLGFAIRYGIVIPFFYSMVLLWAILRAIRVAYQQRRNHSYYAREMATYCAVAPWASLTLITYFEFSQLTEVLLTNLGFLVITGMFIFSSFRRVRKESSLIIEFDLVTNDPPVIAENCKRYGLTSREIDVVVLICQRFSYREIAERLFISQRTVDKHVENIFNKVSVSNKVVLVRKMNGL